MGWSAYSESLRISYANPALIALQPTDGTLRLLGRLAASSQGGSSQGGSSQGGSSQGLTAASLTEQLYAPSFDETVRGGVSVRVLRTDCYATAERVVRGMAPHALCISDVGFADYMGSLSRAVRAAASASTKSSQIKSSRVESRQVKSSQVESSQLDRGISSSAGVGK